MRFMIQHLIRDFKKTNFCHRVFGEKSQKLASIPVANASHMSKTLHTKHGTHSMQGWMLKQFRPNLQIPRRYHRHTTGSRTGTVCAFRGFACRFPLSLLHRPGGRGGRAHRECPQRWEKTPQRRPRGPLWSPHPKRKRHLSPAKLVPDPGVYSGKNYFKVFGISNTCGNKIFPRHLK